MLLFFRPVRGSVLSGGVQILPSRSWYRRSFCSKEKGQPTISTREDRSEVGATSLEVEEHGPRGGTVGNHVLRRPIAPATLLQ